MNFFITALTFFLLIWNKSLVFSVYCLLLYHLLITKDIKTILTGAPESCAGAPILTSIQLLEKVSLEPLKQLLVSRKLSEH